MAKIPLPYIIGPTQYDMILQMRSYLHQLAGELEWALETIEKGSGTASASVSPSTGRSAQESFREVQSLIVQSAAIFDAYYDKMSERLKNSNTYAPEDNFPGGSAAFAKKITDALEEAGALEDGKSAYQLALDHGFKGSEEEWLESLNGEDGKDGQDGKDGTNGKSAYEIALANGFEGTEAEWLASLGDSIILTSPSGAKYQLAVDDSGVLSAVPI